MFFFFFPVAAIALIGVHYYLYRRLIRPLPSRALRTAGVALLVALLACASFGAMLQRLIPSAATLQLQRLSYAWMVVGLYCLLALAAVDLARIGARGVRWLRRRRSTPQSSAHSTSSNSSASATASTSTSATASSSLAEAAVPAAAVPAAPGATPLSESRRRFLMNSGLLGLGLALPTSAFGFWSAGHCRATRVPVRLDALPPRLSGFSIALLSDIHAGGFVDRDFVQALVDETNALSPDVVLIAGDLVDGSVPALAPIVAPLAGLRARLGTFFVIGNHELYSGVGPWTAHLGTLGIRVLRNERVDLDGIELCGVDDWTAARRGLLPGYDLDAVLAGRRGDRPALLLTHQPRGFRAAAERGIDLQLSGHTHGGQLFPFQPIARRANDGYLAGLYRHQRGQLYVTRGCGYWGPPARVGAPPEIANIVLLPVEAPAR